MARLMTSDMENIQKLLKSLLYDNFDCNKIIRMCVAGMNLRKSYKLRWNNLSIIWLGDQLKIK